MRANGMALGTVARSGINRMLRVLNLRLETLTAERLEARRLGALDRGGHFSRRVFPVARSFESMEVARLLASVDRYRNRFDDFEDPSRNDVGYTFRNAYFGSPDAEVLYAVIRDVRPTRVIEVGSGYSTRIMRQAILDGHLDTRLVCIDPAPRQEITGLADAVHRQAVEAVGDAELFRSLKAGDILFVDSSHEIRTGNDVVFLYLVVLPELAPGVLIHVHDVFLPYDYPSEWVIRHRFGWNEQYLVQAILLFSHAFDVLWAGHFLQSSRAEFGSHFPHAAGRRAQSLWLRKVM
jgi:hypothetical protein